MTAFTVGVRAMAASTSHVLECVTSMAILVTLLARSFDKGHLHRFFWCAAILAAALWYSADLLMFIGLVGTWCGQVVSAPVSRRSHPCCVLCGARHRRVCVCWRVGTHDVQAEPDWCSGSVLCCRRWYNKSHNSHTKATHSHSLSLTLLGCARVQHRCTQQYK